eukprot:scaffold11027_cov63-Phaeocystis_antarctica.AAC.7
MFGTIEVPKNFYEYDKRDEAMMTTRQTPKSAVEKAAVRAEEKALKQAAVQQANAEKDAVKRATAKKAKEDAAAEDQSEPAEEKTTGNKATKQEAAVQGDLRFPLERDLAPGTGGHTRSPRSVFRNWCGHTRSPVPATRPGRFPHLNHQAKQAAPGFHGVIGIFLSVLMLLLALGLRQRV